MITKLILARSAITRRLRVNDISDDARVLVGFIERPDGSGLGKGWVAILDRPLFVAIATPDFSGDGVLDCIDIDALVAQIAAGTNSSLFDLTGDGLVDTADLDEWRVQGGASNLPSGNPYLVGDANLDGTVDGQDYIAWNIHKFTNEASWCHGDFTADGVIDVQDFIKWNNNKFTSADGISVVPEPASHAWPIVAMLLAAASNIRWKWTR